MIKTALFELEKLLQRRLALAVLAGLLLANCLLTHYQITRVNDWGYSVQDIRLVYDELEGLDGASQLAWLDARIEEADSQARADIEAGRAPFMAGLPPPYRAVRDQVAAVAGYSDYLADISRQADDLMASLVLAPPGSYNHMNVELTKRAYAGLDSRAVPAGFSGGITLVCDDRLTDMMILLGLAMLGLHLLVSEREEGTLGLIRATRRGGAATIVAKAGVLAALCLLAVTLFYGSAFVLTAAELGLGDLSRPIQSLDGYLASPLPISVAGFIPLFIAAKALAVTALMSVFFLLCVMLCNAVYPCLAGVLLLVAQMLLTQAYGPRSPLALLAYWNLAALLDSVRYFNDYLNIELFGYPVNTAVIGLAAAVVSITGGIGGGVCAYLMDASSQARRDRLTELLGRITSLWEASPRGAHTSLWRHEAHKLLVMERGLLVLLALALVQSLYLMDMRLLIDREEYFYQVYSWQLAGPLNVDKSSFVQAERERFDSVGQERERIYQMYERGEIDIGYMDYLLGRLDYSLEQQNAFDRAYAQYMALSALAADGQEVEYVYQTGWALLLGRGAARGDLTALLKLHTTLVLGLSALGAVERSTRVEVLASLAVRGRGDVGRAKAALAAAFAFVAFAVAFLPRMLAVFGRYGFDPGVLTVSASSLTVVGAFPGWMAVWMLLALRLATYLLVGVDAAVVVWAISRRAGNTVTAMLASAVVTVLPVAALLLI